MDFDENTYTLEMKTLIDSAIEKLSKEKPGFEIYTVSIWTDANAAVSSINFDSKANSDAKVEESNAWSKKYFDEYTAEGDFEQAKLFEPTGTRNCSPADFELRDYVLLNNASIPEDWEEQSDGDCWDTLGPLLQQVGKYAFDILVAANIAPDFELSVNGREDWYEFTWAK